MASHQAIREVVEAFNRGELQVEVIVDYNSEMDRDVLVNWMKRVQIEIRAQPEQKGPVRLLEESRVITTLNFKDQTARSCI